MDRVLPGIAKRMLKAVWSRLCWLNCTSVRIIRLKQDEGV
jgi:hypothetical protein